MTTIFSAIQSFFFGADEEQQMQMEQAQQAEEMQAEQDRLAQEMEEQMEQQVHETNPYENPGQDAVIDESYFGLDEGLGIVNPSEPDFPADDTLNYGGDDWSGMDDDRSSGGDDWSSMDNDWSMGNDDFGMW